MNGFSRALRTLLDTGPLRLVGPGLVVMLADTDAGSVLTAARSGRDWGHRLLLLQLALIPIMYFAQELSVRVGLSTGRGFLEATERRFGRPTGVVAALLLGLSCFGALVTELCGLAGIGQMVGIPPAAAAFGTALAIFVVFAGHSHRSVERIALVLGAFELAFVIAAWRVGPDLGSIAAETGRAMSTDRAYLLLVAAAIGTAVMPWTIAYQQSALVSKGLGIADLGAARIDTALGAIVCQIVTASILVVFAARPGAEPVAEGLFAGIPGLARDFMPEAGGPGPVIFAAALGGAALVATIVVCLTTGWAVCEITGEPGSLDRPLREAPVLYGVLAAMLAAGAALVACGSDLVDLAIGIGAWNAVLLPAVLGILIVLARDPDCGAHRLGGGKAFAIAALLLSTSAFGLWAAARGLTTG